MHRIWNNSIYPKLVTGFLLAIIPVYIVAMSLNQSGANHVREKNTQSFNARMTFYMRSLEQELTSTKMLMNSLSQDSDLQKLSTIAPAMPRSEYYQSINRLHDKMRLLQGSNQYMDSAKVYIPLISKTIQESSYVDPLSGDQVAALIEAPNNVIFRWNDKLLLGLANPDHVRPGKDPGFVIVTELSIPLMQQALATLATESGGAALVSADQSWSVFHAGGEANGPQIVDKLNREALARAQLLRQTYDENITVDNAAYWTSVMHSDYLNADLIMFVPQSEFIGPLSQYRLILFGLSAFSFLVVIVFSYWIYNRIHRPLHRMVRAFRKIDIGNLQVKLTHTHNDEFRYLYEQFNLMVERLGVLIDEVYEQKIRSQRFELKQLQSQINPHFLYNSFFTLHQMGEMQDYENIVRFTRILGEYFKFITRNAADDVALEAEVAHAKAYVDIQTIRFRHRITASWEPIPEHYTHYALPLLVLQPLIENAYEHGLEDKEADGRIVIRMQEHEGGLTLSVDDNGDALTDARLEQLRELLASPEANGEVTGLLNVHRRLQLRFGQDGGLRLSRSDLGGLSIELKLPLEKGEVDPVSIADCG
jgi:two-component system sensor histidine kinase YesM